MFETIFAELHTATLELLAAARGLRSAHRHNAKTVDAWAEQYEVALARHDAVEAKAAAALAAAKARL